ncbi:CocE/NonD family hydrolase [Actinocorallia sp. A-T 12471]|uniref:CocE/NonD family hydrolase n=1 Tax=Actinocorallia sp. A-T 12471 TaxID=3089813 RepID=UPI0029D152E9|nr:CocE/NonD family hydrolase [Actinocorallia sp. A-T 12471]MDX6741376.1 CocE/NonD family hydrolase [Actinocorallia sp. A-T 12471]
MPTVQKAGPAPAPSDAAALTIPMRDGVRLAADLYRVEGDEPRPVILVRLPYDKNGAYCFMPEIARYFRARGYHVVVQDVRGKYRSEGATEFGLHEPDDGHDTIAWIAGRDWCDGNVVMWGDSYYGYTTIAAAVGAHPALKAIAPRLTGSQLSTVLDYGDGTREVEQTARKVYFAAHYVDNDGYEWEPDWSVRPLRAEFEAFYAAIGKRSANFDAEFAGPSPFVPPPLKALLEAPPIPALYTIGWFDNCALWSWHDVRALAAHPRWASRLHLRMEAIDHENYRLADAPIAPEDDHTTSPDALVRLLPRYLDPALAFFDAVLGDRMAEYPRVSYEVCHGERLTASQWPPPSADALAYVLTPAAGLVKEAAGERAEERELRWTHDPADLVPSPGANPFAALKDRADLRATAERQDVLRFTGEAADHDTDLLGPVALHARLSAPAGAHLHVRLLDQAPDGDARLITKGQIRIAEQTDRTEVRVDLLEVAYRLRAGHRLALDLTSSDFPDHVPEAPPGVDPWSALPGTPSPRTVTLGGDSPSRLLIGPS